jgi:hypothetical protein
VVGLALVLALPASAQAIRGCKTQKFRYDITASHGGTDNYTSPNPDFPGSQNSFFDGIAFFEGTKLKVSECAGTTTLSARKTGTVGPRSPLGLTYQLKDSRADPDNPDPALRQPCQWGGESHAVATLNLEGAIQVQPRRDFAFVLFTGSPGFDPFTNGILSSFQAACPGRTYFTGTTYVGRLGPFQVSLSGPLNPIVAIDDADDAAGGAPRGMKKLAAGKSTTFRLENEPHDAGGPVSGTFNVKIDFSRAHRS